MSKANFRISLIFCLILLSAFIIVIRLYNIQILSSDAYLSRAEGQYIERNYHLYDRGDIFFKTKNGEKVSAATIQGGFILTANPELLDKEVAFEELSNIIELDEEKFFSRVERGGNYREIKSRISEEEADKIRSLNLSGISLSPERWRSYPGGSIAAHTLGILGFQGDEFSGRYGLERYYEGTLSRPLSEYRVNLFARLFTNIENQNGSDVSEAGDIVTTIEPVVQLFLENVVKDYSDKWQAKEVGGVIIDPKTGRITAMALMPSFNPNDLREVDISVLSNSLVENVYEMGSVVKALTIAAGIDSGAIEPSSTYVDRGYLNIDGFTISNYDGKARGEIDMQQVLNESVNTGVVHVVDEMGSESFSDYMRKFGFSDKTGIDLPNEADNLIRNFESPRRVEYATASFGQGVAVTPLGMTRSLLALANGGYIVRPYLVEGIEFENGDYIHLGFNKKEIRGRVISEETSRKISRMLVNTVDEALLGGSVAMENYTIAAKTGTAQMAKEDARGYKEDEFLHSFFGYFPAYDPEFLVFIYGVDPKGARYASETLTHPFMDITSFLINYYEITPDR